MERIQKTKGCKACQIRTGHLFETHKGGTYWDREGKRRHFQRTRSEDFSLARQALSWKASEEPAWSSSLGWGAGWGYGKGTTSNPAPVFLAHSPCPLSGVVSCCPLSLDQEGCAQEVLVLWEAGGIQVSRAAGDLSFAATLCT